MAALRPTARPAEKQAGSLSAVSSQHVLRRPGRRLVQSGCSIAIMGNATNYPVDAVARLALIG